MVSIVVERRIAASQEAVFAWLNDSSNYTAAPLCLRERRTRDGQQAAYGVGAIREVLAIGAWFREEITSYQPPEEFDYLIVRSVPRFVHRGGTVRVRPVDGGSHVEWTSAYTIPWWWGGIVFERLSGWMLRTSFVGILAAAARALEP